MAGNYNPTMQKMKGNKDNNTGEKTAINHDTVTQDMGKIHLTSTSKFLLKYVTGHSLFSFKFLSL